MSTEEIDLHRLDLAYADLRVVDRRYVAKLAADIGCEGQRQPVLVTERDGRLVLIDGYCRVEAVRKLGRDTVLAMTLPLSERDALLFAYRTGVGRRRFALEDGWLLKELIERFSMKQSELALLLGRTDSFVSRRLALVVQLPETIQKAVRDGLIGAHAAQRSLVPLARANRGHAERLVANLAGTIPTTRQVASLYRAWRIADRETRERIVDNPGLFLKAQRIEEGTPLEVDAEEKLVQDLEAVAGLCRRARRQVREGAFAGTNDAPCRAAWTQAHEAFLSLEREVVRVEPRDA